MFTRAGVFVPRVEALCTGYGLRQFLPAMGPNGDPNFAWIPLGDPSDVPSPLADAYVCEDPARGP